MTFTKYIYSVLLAVTIGLLLLFFVPSLKDKKNDKIVYNYEVIEKEIAYAEQYELGSLNGDKEYILYFSLYYYSDGVAVSHTFLLSQAFTFYEVPNFYGHYFYIQYVQQNYDYKVYIALYNSDDPLAVSFTANYKVLIMEVA